MQGYVVCKATSTTPSSMKRSARSGGANDAAIPPEQTVPRPSSSRPEPCRGGEKIEVQFVEGRRLRFSNSAQSGFRYREFIRSWLAAASDSKWMSTSSGPFGAVRTLLTACVRPNGPCRGGQNHELPASRDVALRRPSPQERERPAQR